MPKVTFQTFILSMASSGLVHLGEVGDPQTGKKTKNKTMAKYSIDLLTMLQEKTQGNLDSQEEQMLANLLFELRMKYVQIFGEKSDK